MNWIWVKGHAGHDQNERCDDLAATGNTLAIDDGYLREEALAGDETLL